MKTRGRDSAASLSVIGPNGVETIRRPDPPVELTAEQAEEWRAVVNRLRADWFPRETHAVLAQYCRHVVMARRVAQLIAQAEATDPFNVEDYDLLARMQERESRTLASLATRLRITNQSLQDPRRKRGAPAAPKPWEAG